MIVKVKPDHRQEPTAMTTRRRCPPAPGTLENLAQQLDPRLAGLVQRLGLRGYPQGLPLPRNRNRDLTGLGGREPIVGAQPS
jgi:hypothetical protein